MLVIQTKGGHHTVKVWFVCRRQSIKVKLCLILVIQTEGAVSVQNSHLG